MGFPSREDINEVLKNITEDDFSYSLPEDANMVDRLKYELCKFHVSYILDNRLSVEELSQKIDLDFATTKKIITYRINSFIVDDLFISALKINPLIELKIS